MRPRDLASTEAEDQVKRRLLLHIVVGEGASVFQLLAGKDETLLVRRDSLLVLYLGLDIVDRVGRLDLECDGFPGESFDKNLHRVGGYSFPMLLFFLDDHEVIFLHGSGKHFHLSLEMRVNVKELLHHDDGIGIGLVDPLGRRQKTSRANVTATVLAAQTAPVLPRVAVVLCDALVAVADGRRTPRGKVNSQRRPVSFAGREHGVDESKKGQVLGRGPFHFPFFLVSRVYLRERRLGLERLLFFRVRPPPPTCARPRRKRLCVVSRVRA